MPDLVTRRTFAFRQTEQSRDWNGLFDQVGTGGTRRQYEEFISSTVLVELLKEHFLDGLKEINR